MRDEVMHSDVVKFAGVPGNDLAERVDEDECGPCVDRERLPDRKVGVRDHGVMDPETLSRERKTFGVALGRKFWRVDANDLKLVRESELEPMQIRKNVNAIDAAGGPEVEQHHLAAQVRNAECR